MTISAVLLAGGKSSRMGQDKATMLFRGGPLWKHQLDLLRRIEPEEILVSAQTDPPWRPPDTIFVADQQPSCGPLGGIAAALSQIIAEHLLVLAIDMPFMTDKYLEQLCNRLELDRGLIPMRKDKAEPLAAVYPRDAESEFLRSVSSADFSLQPLIRRLIEAGKLRPIAIEDHETRLFRNLNEPQDIPVSGL